jgi:hypothetical protein
LKTISNKCSGGIVADVWVGEGGFGEKSSLFNPKINHWLIWESTRNSTKEGKKSFFSLLKTMPHKNSGIFDKGQAPAKCTPHKNGGVFDRDRPLPSAAGTGEG